MTLTVTPQARQSLRYNLPIARREEYIDPCLPIELEVVLIFRTKKQSVTLIARVPLTFAFYLSSMVLNMSPRQHPELIDIDLYWSANTNVSMCGSPQEKLAHEFVPAQRALLVLFE